MNARPKPSALRAILQHAASEDEPFQPDDGDLHDELLSLPGRAQEALRESEHHFRALFEASPDAIFVEDLEGTILDVNPTACRLHHAERSTLVGQNTYDMVPLDQREAAREDFRKLADGTVSHLESYRWTVHQQAVPVEIRAAPFTYKGAPAVLLHVRDISERKQAELALKESEARARAILETSVDAIITIDERGRIESFNPAAERIFGYAAEEAIGQNVKLLMPSPYQEEHDGYLEHYLTTGETKIIGTGREMVARRKDGSVFPIDLAVSDVPFEDHHLFTGLIRDISDRRRLEQEVLHISEHERERIGRDLHDGLGSFLTGVAMGAEGLAQAAKRGHPINTDDLDELAQLIEDAAAEAQALARGLNPVKLEQEGLTAALQELVAQTQSIAKIACTFDYDGALPVLPGVLAIQIYRIAQEAINNAVKHAQARHIQVRLALDGTHLVLTVRDDGIGLPAGRSAWDEGTGLYIMPYRANLIGALFTISGAPDGGTVVSCSTPLEKARPAPSATNP